MCIRSHDNVNVNAMKEANPQSPPELSGRIPRKPKQHKPSQPQSIELQQQHHSSSYQRQTASATKRKHENLLPPSSATPRASQSNDLAAKRRKYLSDQIKAAAKNRKATKNFTIIPILKEPKYTNNSDNVSSRNNNSNSRNFSILSLVKKAGVSFAAGTKTTTQKVKLGYCPRISTSSSSSSSSSSSDTLFVPASNNALILDLKKGIYSMTEKKNFLERIKSLMTSPNTNNINSSTTAAALVPSNNKNKLEEYKLMCKTLKIFIAAEVALERTDRYLSMISDTNSHPTELKINQNKYARHLFDDVIKCISRYQQEQQQSSSNDSELDFNISLFGGISLLHAAVLLHDKNIVSELLLSTSSCTCTVYENTVNEKYGTAMDLARNLSDRAISRGDAKLAIEYYDIFRMLLEA